MKASEIENYFVIEKNRTLWVICVSIEISTNYYLILYETGIRVK